MIEAHHRGAVHVVQFTHGKVNALDVELAATLAGAVEAAGNQSGSRAIVLTGGGSAFSAGVDLKRYVAEDGAYADRLLDALDRLFDAIYCCPKPIVAAINGHALAGGMVIAAACDLRVMAQGRGRIGVPEIAAGVPFPWIALEITRAAVSPEHLPELVALGATFATDEALRRGLVQQLAEPAELIDRAVALAEQLGHNAGPAFDLQRQQLRGPAMADPRRATHDAQVRDVWRREETRARVREYLSRLGAAEGRP
ncbi:MAG: enoyl-CoA hydratase/isomerase family protein [Planctomycetes bacterium]|nr:enoyl-CoA hydratase/isomerase family protein [Planctomycetota bacterium]